MALDDDRGGGGRSRRMLMAAYSTTDGTDERGFNAAFIRGSHPANLATSMRNRTPLRENQV